MHLLLRLRRRLRQLLARRARRLAGPRLTRADRRITGPVHRDERMHWYV